MDQWDLVLSFLFDQAWLHAHEYKSVHQGCDTSGEVQIQMNIVSNGTDRYERVFSCLSSA
jgi:hypothetical protein